MPLVLQAIRYMIWLQAGVIVLVCGLGVYLGDMDSVSRFLLLGFASIGLLLVARLGAQRQWVWVMIPFAIWCAFGVFSGTRGGTELTNIPNLLDAILCLVALVGLNDWRNDRRRSRAATEVGSDR